MKNRKKMHSNVITVAYKKTNDSIKKRIKIK